MIFQLRELAGTGNYIILQRDSENTLTLIVAEIVHLLDGYSIYRMDVIGVVASGIASPEDAFLVFQEWVARTGTFPTPVPAA